MEFNASEVNREHPVMLAGRLMLDLYSKSDGTPEEVCHIVHSSFPELTAQQVFCLWVGVNMAECPLVELDKIELVMVE
ncbi:hypothetical protein ACOIVT_004226 [Vibrio parahaemolyticus]